MSKKNEVFIEVQHWNRYVIYGSLVTCAFENELPFTGEILPLDGVEVFIPSGTSEQQTLAKREKERKRTQQSLSQLPTDSFFQCGRESFSF